MKVFWPGSAAGRQTMVRYPLVLGLLITGLFGPIVAAAETPVVRGPFRFELEEA